MVMKFGTVMLVRIAIAIVIRILKAIFRGREKNDVYNYSNSLHLVIFL